MDRNRHEGGEELRGHEDLIVRFQVESKTCKGAAAQVMWVQYER